MKTSHTFRVAALVMLAAGLIATHAVTPASTISYRGRLVDASGIPVADGANFIRFVIYDSATAGTELWNSGIQQVPTTDGLFTYQLGSSTPLPAGLFDGSPTLYLGITVGADPEITPRTMFTSSAFAYHSRRADTATIAQDAILLNGEPASSYLTTEVGLGDITGVTTIDGLTGGGTTGDVKVGVATGGITSSHIADSSIGAADINSSQVQRRVSGSAGAGQAIKAINPDGTVTGVAVGNGDITGVTATGGLSGGGNSGSVTVQVAQVELQPLTSLPGRLGQARLRLIHSLRATSRQALSARVKSSMEASPTRTSAPPPELLSPRSPGQQLTYHQPRQSQARRLTPDR